MSLTREIVTKTVITSRFLLVNLVSTCWWLQNKICNKAMLNTFLVCSCSDYSKAGSTASILDSDVPVPVVRGCAFLDLDSCRSSHLSIKDIIHLQLNFARFKTNSMSQIQNWTETRALFFGFFAQAPVVLGREWWKWNLWAPQNTMEEMKAAFVCKSGA
jgi:hypothetical protein